MSTRKFSIWQNYEIDPVDLIGRPVRLSVVTDLRVTSVSVSEVREGLSIHHFGVVESIEENRGKVYYERSSSSEGWADMLAAEEGDVYPSVTVRFQGGRSVTFNPEKDAASFQWSEA